MDHGSAVLIQILHRPQGSQVWGGLQGNCSWGCHLAKAFTRCQGLAGSALQDGGVTSEHWNFAALICHNASTSLIICGNMCLDTNKLKIHLIGIATFKTSDEPAIHKKTAQISNFFTLAVLVCILLFLIIMNPRWKFFFNVSSPWSMLFLIWLRILALQS